MFSEIINRIRFMGWLIMDICWFFLVRMGVGGVFMFLMKLYYGENSGLDGKNYLS